MIYLNYSTLKCVIVFRVIKTHINSIEENKEVEETKDESKDDIIIPTNVTVKIPELKYLQEMLNPYRKKKGNFFLVEKLLYNYLYPTVCMSVCM